MSEFTKGPWECQDSEDSDLIHIGPVNEMGIMEFCVTSVHNEGHANLIAAAPDMLDALEELTAMVERQPDFNDDGDGLALSRCYKAIAKTKGENQ